MLFPITKLKRKKSDLEATRASLYPTFDLSSGINNNRKESSGDERNIENKISLSYRITDFGVRGANIRKSEYEKTVVILIMKNKKTQ